MSKTKPKKVPKALVERKIIERNRMALAHLELAGDKVFKALPEDEKNRLIKEVMAVGDETAKWVVDEYKSDDPRKIAVKMGLRIYGEESQELKKSEYRHEKKEIAISRRFHEKLLREIKSKEISERLLKLVVAQELFRHIELDRIGEVYKRYKFKMWQLGPFVREKFVRGLSDVAAQAFTQRLLGIEVTPQVFDYLVLASFPAS